MHSVDEKRDFSTYSKYLGNLSYIFALILYLSYSQAGICS